MQIDRTAAMLDNARMQMAQAGADRTAALTGMIGGITSSLSNIDLSGDSDTGSGNDDPETDTGNDDEPA